MFFDTPNEKEPEFKILPEGTYRLQIVDSEIKPTKSGEMMIVALEVMEGAHKGTRCSANYNIVNSSAQAQNIGKAQFKQLLTAIGVTKSLQHANDAHREIANKAFWGYVRPEEYQGKTYTKLKKAMANKPEDEVSVPYEPTQSGMDQVPF